MMFFHLLLEIESKYFPKMSNYYFEFFDIGVVFRISSYIKFNIHKR